MQETQNSSMPFSLWIPFAKVDKERRTVSGYATTPDRDMDGEIITLDAIKAALPDYMAWGNIREMHTNRAVGVADAAKTKMDTTGLWLTAKIVDDDAWKKCVEKVYKGFSIGGRKEAVAEKDPSVITAIKLIEISIVDRPANPSCRFDVNKRAKKGEIAHLLRAPSHERAIKKMAQAVELLAKAGPPAAHDGFSLPAKHEVSVDPQQAISAPCEAHGVTDCAECMKKRDFDAKERREAAASGAALPDGSFPIKNAEDLENAHQLLASGHGKDPSAARAHIKSRARALGLPDPFKDKKSKKSKKLAKVARRRQALAAAKSLVSASLSLPAIEADDLVESGHELDLKGGEVGAAPPFLILRKGKTKEVRLAKRMRAAGDLSMCFDMLRQVQRDLLREAKQEGGDKKDEKLAAQVGEVAQRLAAVVGQKATHEGEEAISLSDADDQHVNSLEDFAMNASVQRPVPTLEEVLMKAVRKAKAPTRAQMMMRASRDLKKARKSAKDMEECMKALHAMHKSAFLAKQAAIIKAGKKKPDDGDDDDFDHQGAMEKIQKAYSNLSTMKTMMKSVKLNLAKAVGRSGQRGQEAGDSEPGFYEVPSGVKDLSPSQMARLSPGSTESGSEPPIQALDVEWKAANTDRRITNMIQKGYISTTEAEARERAVAAEAKLEILEKMPANGGRRPVLFDARQLAGPDNSRTAALFEGVDQTGLHSDDESVRKSAVGTLIGNMVFKGMGRNVLDPEFRGRGGI